jgi:hypothetical protein
MNTWGSGGIGYPDTGARYDFTFQTPVPVGCGQGPLERCGKEVCPLPRVESPFLGWPSHSQVILVIFYLNGILKFSGFPILEFRTTHPHRTFLHIDRTTQAGVERINKRVLKL